MGGIFTSQNKVRPGTYINFKAIAAPLSTLGTRGVMTMPVAMSWGATITELFSTDLVDGNSVSKIGFNADAPESLLFREALKNCYKAIVYRLDTGGVKALASIGDLNLVAKYPGIVGNDITVSVVVNGANFDVLTYYNGKQKDKQTVAVSDELIGNDWVDFSYTTGTLTANVGTPLITGADGTIVDATYETYRNAIATYTWQTMAIPYVTTLESDFLEYVTQLREVQGKKVQVVLYNDVTSDYEGIITVAQGYTTDNYTVSPTQFTAYFAGLTAGALPDESNTYHKIIGATSIVYPDDITPYTNDEIIAKLKSGKIVISNRQDSAIIIEQDINTFRTYTPDKDYSFSKNRLIRTYDEIATQLSLIFSLTYIGKIDNSSDGRNLYKSDVIDWLNRFQTTGAIKNFNGADEVTIYQGEAIDSVVIDLVVQGQDAMEKLYMTITVG